MSARRPWKLILLAVFAIGLVLVTWARRDDQPQDITSQWAAPEAVSPSTTQNVKDPFPQLKKVLTPEEIRSGHWGTEPSPRPEPKE